MDGLCRSLPRRVLRHVIRRSRLGIGSRVLVEGDEADAVAMLFIELGIEAEVADAVPPAGSFDAVMRLDGGTRPIGDRSLLSAAALARTARLLGAIRPQGTFQFVARVGNPDGGHNVACLERHLAAFPGRVRLRTMADRWSLGDILRGGPRPGYAVATWQAGEVIGPPTCGSPETCCRWAVEAGRSQRAA